jgi:hypothetical protein
MKDNQLINPIISDDFKTVTFEVRGKPNLVLDMTKLHENVRARSACVGMAQVRIIDAAAVSRADSDGTIRTLEEMLELKYQKMADLIAHYMTSTPEWNRKRSAGSGAAKDVSGITLKAMQRVWPDKDCEALAFRMEQKRGISRREAYAVFAQTREVAAAIAAIKAERATVSADDLIAEMGDEDDEEE